MMLDNKFVISLISRGMLNFQGSRVMRLPEHSMLNTNNLVIRIQLEFSLFRKSSMFGRIRTTNAYTHTQVFSVMVLSVRTFSISSFSSSFHVVYKTPQPRHVILCHPRPSPLYFPVTEFPLTHPV